MQLYLGFSKKWKEGILGNHWQMSTCSSMFGDDYLSVFIKTNTYLAACDLRDWWPIERVAVATETSITEEAGPRPGPKEALEEPATHGWPGSPWAKIGEHWLLLDSQRALKWVRHKGKGTSSDHWSIFMHYSCGQPEQLTIGKGRKVVKGQAAGDEERTLIGRPVSYWASDYQATAPAWFLPIQSSSRKDYHASLLGMQRTPYCTCLERWAQFPLTPARETPLKREAWQHTGRWGGLCECTDDILNIISYM